MNPLLVVNPRAGGGATGRTFSGMKSTIERALGDVDVAMTERPGHGADLAREGALAGHPLVIAVGGDGTFHEVVNGLMQAKDRQGSLETELGLIAQGTGGDFRRTLGLEHRLDRYLEALASGRTRSLDVGRFSGGGKASHYFVNILSAGMGGLVDRYVADASRALGGSAAYFTSSLRALVNAKVGNLVCTITNEGKTSEERIRTLMIAVCNGQYFGGGMQVGPMAQIDDGTFDIVALKHVSKLAMATSSSDIYKGAHLRKGNAVHFRAQKLTIDLANDDARDRFLLDVDGEPMGTLPVTLEAVPNALTLRA